MSQTIFITGTNSGFGNLTTNTLLQAGYKVIGSMRDLAGRNKTSAEELRARGAIVVEMDVTSDASVNAAVESALAQAGSIDVVVNNAGVGTSGRQESFTTEDWQRLFDINVFGVQRVLRAVIPHFRARRSGSIINISSVLGRMVLPYFGPYNASKHALEALTENYRVELSQFGVDVSMVEPGGFLTDFLGSLITPSDTEREGFYQDIHPTPEEIGAGFAETFANNPDQKPQDVADAVLKLLQTEPAQRPLRTVVDKLGMGAAVEPYNEAHTGVTQGIYGAFGLAHLLELKS